MLHNSVPDDPMNLSPTVLVRKGAALTIALGKISDVYGWYEERCRLMTSNVEVILLLTDIPNDVIPAIRLHGKSEYRMF